MRLGSLKSDIDKMILIDDIEDNDKDPTRPTTEHHLNVPAVERGLRRGW